MVTSSLHVLVWEEDGEELLILISVQEMIVLVSGAQSGISFCRVASEDWEACSSASFSTNGISYQRLCERARGYQKGKPFAFYVVCTNITIDEDYVSGLSITYSNNPR